MPRPVPARSPVAESLSPAGRAFLDELLADLELDPRHDPLPAGVASAFEVSAFLRATRAVQAEEGCSAERARIVAGLRLDLNEETLERRIRRLRAAVGADNLSGVHRRAG